VTSIPLPCFFLPRNGRNLTSRRRRPGSVQVTASGENKTAKLAAATAASIALAISAADAALAASSAAPLSAADLYGKVEPERKKENRFDGTETAALKARMASGKGSAPAVKAASKSAAPAPAAKKAPAAAAAKKSNKKSDADASSSGASHTLVPIRPTPRFQSRHTSTPFNSASDAFQLHPDVRSY
jgi:hypothetical protein